MFFSGTSISLSAIRWRDWDVTPEEDLTLYAQWDARPAPGKCGDGLTWDLDDAGTLTIRGSGPMYNFYYEDEYTAPWQEEAGSIVRLVIEPGVTSIGKRTFMNLYALESADISEGVTRIGESAFFVTALKEIIVPHSVEVIESDAFLDNWAMKRVILSSGVRSIGYRAFMGCGAESVQIPGSVEYIGEEVFSYCLAPTMDIYYGGSEEQWRSLVSIEEETCWGENGSDITVHYDSHHFSEEWSGDATHHWHDCADVGCADISEKAEHIWGTGAETAPATFAAEGVMTFTCTVCGRTKTEAIPKLDPYTSLSIRAIRVSGDKVTVDVANELGLHVTLLVASYTPEGRFLAIAFAEVPGTEQIEVTLDTGAAGTVTAFLVDDPHSLKPLCRKFEQAL